MRERPLTLKIWFALTLVTFLTDAFVMVPQVLTLPSDIPPELTSSYFIARLLRFSIFTLANLIVYYGVWIGNRIAYIIVYILLIIQMVRSLLSIIPTFWLYEAIVQMTLLALSWKYFFD